MNKKDFVQAVCAATNLGDKQVRAVLAAGQAVVIEELRRGGSINVMGLGQLLLKPRAERKARDMRRGQEVLVPPGAVIRFIPTKSVAHDLRSTSLDKLKGGQV